MTTKSPSIDWKAVTRAARDVAQSYMRYEVADIAQAISLDMIEHPKRYQIGGPLFEKALRRAGYRYCQDQASRDLAGADQHTYSAEEIKSLLHSFYDPENWPNGWSQPEWDSFEGTAAEFSEDLELWAESTRIFIDLFDLEAAVSKLRSSHKRVIEKKYRDGLKLTTSEQDAHGDAIRLLTFYVNGSSSQYRGAPWDYEGPGARKAISNAHAQHITSSEY